MVHTADPFSVVHSAGTWLSQTMTWLYSQVRNLPAHVESWVVCDRSLNQDQFPTPHLVDLDRDGAFWRHASAWSWKVAKRRRARLLDATIRESGAALVHSHFGDRAWLNHAGVARQGLAHVVSFYGYDMSLLPFVEPVWRDRYRVLFDSADSFLCEGPMARRSLCELGCPPEKLTVHHLGVDLERLPFHPRSWRPGERLRVLVAGSFVEKKGIPYAIAALGRIRSRADLEIIVVGDADDQERSRQEKRRILEAIDANDLGSCTRLLGYQRYTDLLRIASNCHVFLSPSVTASDRDAEGGAPMTIIEMAAAGMPIVSSRHCDIETVLQDGVTGLLAAERDVDGLAEKLEWLLEHPESWAALGSAARLHIERHYDAREQGRLLAAHYATVLDGSRRSPPRR